MLQVDFQPFPILYTERCLLRKIVQEDAPEILLLRSEPSIMQYLDRDPMTSLDEARSFITRIEESLSQGMGITWGICLHNSTELIGKIGLWRLIKEHYRAEIGYTLHPGFWGKGIMTEVLQEVIRYGFKELGLHSLEANVNPSNLASIKLLKKQGFIQEGYFRESYFYNGTFLDSAIFSLITKK